MRYVIIGNSVAAVNACQGIRELDREGTITIISAENYYAYGRPLISYWLEGKTDFEKMPYQPVEFYQKNKINVLLGKKAVGLDVNRREVKLDDGSSLPYDRLLIATGGQAIVPPLTGLTAEDYFTFLTYDDVLRLARRASPGKEVVVLGAGPSGLKAMESLVTRGARVTLVELASRIWSLVLDREAAALITRFLEEQGVTVILQDTILGGRRNNEGRLELDLQSGRQLTCDILVVAIGVRPNTELLEKVAGVNLNRGVVVDEYLSIGLPGIYAAGDVVAGGPPLLPHAARQGRIAGRNMAGGREKYIAGPAYNALGFLGLHTISIGISAPEPEEGYEILAEKREEGRIYRKLVLDNNRLVGALFINEFDRAGLYRRLIEEQVDVTPFKDNLLQKGFGFLHLPRELWEGKLGE
ncbi:MAG: NAD(P)/FAD-dependent oxidoreductase [Thermoanaerobacteraceae bacterium]|nr:NAD(P)/FAD-dependent oxidoreductase [Thermoanaerobacteraceae bacterium]